MITGKNYIGNALSAKGEMTYQTLNPKLNVANATSFTEATSEEIDLAVALAYQAFDTYQHISGEKRAAFMHAIADEIEALGDTLVTTYMSETGLPEGRAKGERGRTLGQLRMFADLIKTEDWRNPTISGEANELRQYLMPLGPVVVFGASNFPLAYSTAGGDTASALAAGCPVIVKSHPMHAGTGELVASAIQKAVQKTGMPHGVFSNLNSAGIEVGVQLVKHPMVKAVGFTGSIRGGRALYDLASQREEPIPVFAEMGSINPVIVTQNALNARSEEIAQTYADSITLGVGQFCTNPGLILGIKSPEFTTFTQNLGEKTAAIDANCMLHPNIHTAYEKNGAAVISQPDTTVVAMHQDTVQENYAQAKIGTVSGDAFLKNPKLHQEVFGPFSLVVQCDDTQQLLQIISQLEGQLTGTILAEQEDYKDLSPLIERLQNRVGRIIFNGVPTGVAVVDAMTHGGPYPASTDSRFTAVGNQAIKRWVRPFSYQGFPEELLPAFLK
ncbi:aldehyde dehydrogenase (NADP(+)) [uncultured Dokdonia sp.]|uniref:aldehyde dehydrogenase (NADP(+)) n=1 Tax=uncultured Dokdonia sp. TaxID=575653 RepID=UPI002612B763|nr:aldehyde dehydrogenase (NADP(+)) [uncultured Dokdonia sp.]